MGNSASNTNHPSTSEKDQSNEQQNVQPMTSDSSQKCEDKNHDVKQITKQESLPPLQNKRNLAMPTPYNQCEGKNARESNLYPPLQDCHTNYKRHNFACNPTPYSPFPTASACEKDQRNNQQNVQPMTLHRNSRNKNKSNDIKQKYLPPYQNERNLPIHTLPPSYDQGERKNIRCSNLYSPFQDCHTNYKRPNFACNPTPYSPFPTASKQDQSNNQQNVQPMASHPRPRCNNKSNDIKQKSLPPYQNEQNLLMPTPPPYDQCEGKIARESNLYPPLQDCHTNYKRPNFGFPPPYSPFPTAPYLEELTNEPEKSQENIEPRQIIKELILFNGFFADVQALSRVMAKSISNILKVIEQNENIFKTIEDKSSKKLIIDLCPSVKICEVHSGKFTCSNENCSELHICPDFARDICQQKGCVFGHSWESGPNKYIMQTLFLNDLPDFVLNKIMQKAFKHTITPTVCLSYQKDQKEGKCLLDNCIKLHICYLHVITLGMCPKDSKCPLNHDLFKSQSEFLLEKQGISVNDAPKDIFKIIITGLDMLSKSKINDQGKTKLQLDKKMDKMKRKSPQSIAKSQDISNKVNNDQVKAKSKPFNPKSEFQKGETLDAAKTSQQSIMIEKKAYSHTFCSWHFLGSVASTMICVGNLLGKCDYIHKGCKFLHAKKQYHWQFRINNEWYNFYPPHVEALENKFRNVNCDELILPKLNRENLSKEMTGLYDIFGKNQFKVDFEQMLMECKSSNTLYTIRHLSTASSAIVNKPINTKYHWFFRNDDKWKLFGRDGSSLLLSIEKAYLKYCANSCNDSNIIFSYDSGFKKYEINFSKMLQMDIKMLKMSKVRRRPAPFPCTVSVDTKVPKHLQEIKQNQSYLLLDISPTSPEFAEIESLLRETYKSHVILSVSHLQNPCLWKCFKAKESQLKLKYDLLIKRLFIGISDPYLKEICNSNYDFSKHDNCGFHSFGQGAYFLSSVTEALNSAAVDADGHKLLLIADVIVGKMIEGQPDMNVPPIYGPAGTPYDTLVDALVEPTLFVKYNKDEFYPLYIVKFIAKIA